MKKNGRRRRKEGEEEDEKGNEPPLDVFARFATEHTVTIWILTERSPCRFSLNPRWPHDHSTTRVDADPSCSVILCVGEVRLNHYLIITLVPEPSHS